MVRIEIYSKEWCPYCNRAKALLKTKEAVFDEIDITHDDAHEQEMVRRSR